MNPEYKTLSQEEFDKNIDQVLGIVNRHHEQIREKEMDYETMRIVNEKYEKAREKSKTTQPRKYHKTTKRRSKNAVTQRIVAICAIGVIALSSISLAVEATKDSIARRNFVNTISEHVDDNITYLDFGRDDTGHPLWYYDSIKDIAKETINEHPEIDIDTRIYGTYMGLQEYEKDETMDKVMREMQKIVLENPLEYDESILRACNHNSFTDYLASLNIDKETYLAYMKEITTAYGNNDLDKVEELLLSLNGGGR